MKRSIFAVIFGIFLTSCQGSFVQDKSTPNIPAPPPILDHLPQITEIKCEDNPEYNNNPLSLWQYAARTPQDTSNSNPDRGNKTGSVMFCTQITVLAYEWSAFDEAFWLFIETEEGNQGWVAADYVKLRE